MERQAYDFIAFRQKILKPDSSIYYTRRNRGVVYYCRDGLFIASAHELQPTEGHYEDAILHTIPKNMWHVTHTKTVDSIEALWEVYQDEIRSEWIKG